jgi:hypothetical protein
MHKRIIIIKSSKSVKQQRIVSVDCYGQLLDVLNMDDWKKDRRGTMDDMA